LLIATKLIEKEEENKNLKDKIKEYVEALNKY